MVASVVVGGVAYAAASPKKKVYACTKSNHHVRVLGTKVTCRAGEKRIAWRVRGKKGDTGSRGPAGPRGERGATGSIGNVHTMTLNSPTLSNPPAGTVSEMTTWCPEGQQAVGGGFTFGNQTQRDVVQESNPVVGPTGLHGWHVKYVTMASTGASHYVKVYALCAAT